MSGKVFPWWEETLTVYNRYEDELTNVVTWTRHILNNCFWKFNGTKISIGSVVLEGNSTICRIPQNDLFREKHIWKQLSNSEREQYFTLGVGDIIVKGEISDVIDDYAKGHRASDLIAKYKDLGCIEIQNVAINTGTAKCVPHYYVQGE